jgi:2'-5' RNA ligase
MAQTRTFIALSLPDAHRSALAKLYRDERGFTWTNPEQLHVTMRFIGDLDELTGERLAAELAKIRVAPFFLPLEGVGAFPPRGPAKVIWVGVGRGHPLLFQLRQRIDDTLVAMGLDADVRNFRPHVTLARIRSDAAPVAVRHYLKRHREFSGPQLRVDHFGLYASELTPSGARHSLIRAFPLQIEVRGNSPIGSV